MERDPLEYVLNRMEFASGMSNPVQHGYGISRKELLDGIAALRADLTAALAQLAEKEGQLCTARETFKRYVNHHGGAHYGDCPGDDTCGCDGKPINDAVNAFFISPTPCPHAKEAERLREEYDHLNEIVDQLRKGGLDVPDIRLRAGGEG